MIYLDHAATSWPKPPAVIRAMVDFCEHAGGNPGRSGHRLSLAAARIVYDARESLAELFHVPDPLRIIFTANATHAINLVLRGLLRAGDRVVTTGIEHNAVMRPLRALEDRLGRVESGKPSTSPRIQILPKSPGSAGLTLPLTPDFPSGPGHQPKVSGQREINGWDFYFIPCGKE